MNRSDYINKCKEILNNPQFTKLQDDPVKSTEGLVQRTLRKLKSKFSDQQYCNLHPPGSKTGAFYCTLKVHKLRQGEGIEQLTLWPIISNIGTATYEVAKYLARLLSPLAKFEFTVQSTKQFVDNLHTETLPVNYSMISFDVTSLFTNVPLDRTFDIIITGIYGKEEMATQLSRSELIQLLTLCTKQVPFSFNDEIYIQQDGVAMGSPLGPVLANIFMVQLEREISR